MLSSWGYWQHSAPHRPSNPGPSVPVRQRLTHIPGQRPHQEVRIGGGGGRLSSSASRLVTL